MTDVYSETIIPVENVVSFPVQLTYSNLLFENVNTLIIKVTHRCNLDCDYCYENIQAGPDMAISTFKSLTEQIISASSSRNLSFIFHGGEPTLLDSNWYTEAVDFARQLSKEKGKTISFAMQTNAISINPKLVGVIKRLGIKVSLSLDGPSSIPSQMRKRVEASIKTYKNLISAGIPVGVLTTINHSNYSSFASICEWLSKDMNIKHFKANVVASVGKGIDLPPLSAAMIFQAKSDILEYMIKTEGKTLLEDNLSIELFRFFSSEEDIQKMPTELCRTKKCGAGKTVLGITPNGDFLPCGRFEWNDHGYYLGSDRSKSDEQSPSSFLQTVEDFHSLHPENWFDCDNCEAKKICSFGCQAFTIRSKIKANIECLPTKLMYSYFVKNTSRLEAVFKTIKSAGLRNKRLTSSYPESYNDSFYSDYRDSDDSPFNATGS